MLDDDCGLPKLGEIALCLDVAKGAVPPVVASIAAFFKTVIIELDLGGRRSATELEGSGGYVSTVVV